MIMRYDDPNTLEKAAASGDVTAMGVLGENYLHGNLGLEKNYEKAYQWSKKAADMGNARSLTVLGILYMEGDFVDKNLDAAREKFSEATDKGDMKAPRYLGILFRDDETLSSQEREKKAFECFKCGADRGDITSQFYLGNMYENGAGVDRNLDEAVRWYKESAKRGDKIAQPAMDALKRLGY